MKTINVTFEDQEFDKLNKRKSDLSWRDFILKLISDNSNPSLELVESYKKPPLSQKELNSKDFTNNIKKGDINESRTKG